MNGGNIDEDNHTDEWLRKISRGGLRNVTDDIYDIIYNIYDIIYNVTDNVRHHPYNLRQ